jgi:transposase-like protein
VNTTIIERRRRRRHSAEFKAAAVAACRQPGVSIAAVAMSRSVNANLLRRWVVEAERGLEARRTSTQPKALLRPPIEAQRFVPVALDKPAVSDARIRIEVRRRATTVIVEWPASAARECAEWLGGLVM